MSFSAWYRSFYPTLLAALTVVAADVDLAADATDEAFVRALERWDRVSIMDSPEGWTYRVGVNVLRRRARRWAIERRLGNRADEMDAPAELRVEVWEAVKTLPARQRQAIALRYLLEFTEAEVAQTMGIALGTASATLAGGRAHLAALLGRDDLAEVEP